MPTSNPYEASTVFVIPHCLSIFKKSPFAELSPDNKAYFMGEEGDSIEFLGPDGLFYLQEKSWWDLVVVATGKGIAPFR
ncbi:MAG: hypothetical protein H0W49_10640 [Nitrospirales bacterium]|nr:hypothetical protein [Nitrospirales bacterium]MBA3964505.1 hypothetical protein [Nitrospirales bacterium]